MTGQLKVKGNVSSAQQLARVCVVADTPRPDHARDQARRRPQGVQGQALSRPKGANALVAVACCRVCLWIITRDKRREEKREKEQVRGHKGESAARCSRRARVARDGRGRAQSVVVLSNVSSCADDRRDPRSACHWSLRHATAGTSLSFNPHPASSLRPPCSAISPRFTHAGRRTRAPLH
jgi:hypothetical protein